MKILRLALLAVFAIAVVAVPAHAQNTYEITVGLDDATTADDDLLTAAALAAPVGDVAHSLRKLAAGVMLEVRLLLQRRLSNDFLTLDNGLQVALVEGDTIRAKKAKKCTSQTCDQTVNGAILIPAPGIPGNGTPTYIEIYKDGICTRSLTFPGDGPPSLQAGCGS
jgi:hypothetical protein